jgi:hypothetical protein
MRKGSRVSAKTRESVSAKQYPVMPLFWERLISWKFPGHLEASPLLGQQSFIALPVLRTPGSIRKWEVPDGFEPAASLISQIIPAFFHPIM